MDNNLLFELNSWQDIIHSEGWRVFVKLLKTHQDYLQGQVNSFLRKKQYDDAYAFLAKMDDCQKILSLVQNRISEIRKGGEQNGGHG